MLMVQVSPSVRREQWVNLPSLVRADSKAACLSYRRVGETRCERGTAGRGVLDRECCQLAHCHGRCSTHGRITSGGVKLITLQATNQTGRPPGRIISIRPSVPAGPAKRTWDERPEAPASETSPLRTLTSAARKSSPAWKTGCLTTSVWLRWARLHMPVNRLRARLDGQLQPLAIGLARWGRSRAGLAGDRHRSARAPHSASPLAQTAIGLG
jgi:hypothetical protein